MKEINDYEMEDNKLVYSVHTLLPEEYYEPNFIELGCGLPKTKSHLKVGNMIIHNNHHFNWFERKMWKLFFGFEIENVDE